MATLIAPRYSAEDFDTHSIHSAAPSYISEVPSYHSTVPHNHEAIPAYSASPSGHSQRRNTVPQQQQPQEEYQYGLPPIPPVPSTRGPNIHNFRVPTWSTHNAPAARQYRSVIERRASAQGPAQRRWQSMEAAGSSSPPEPAVAATASPNASDSESNSPRPLEDPYLVGEQAAAEARRERLRRENGDDILIREDKHWDWLLAQMETWEQREKSWTKYRREVERGQRRSLLRSVRGRLA